MNTAHKRLEFSFTPSFSSFSRLIHLDAYPDAEDEAKILFNAAADKLVPKALFIPAYIISREKIGDETEILAEAGVNGSSKQIGFSGKVLGELDSVNRVFPYIITCGNEMETYDLSGMDMLAPFWLDTLKTMALGTARLEATRYIKEKFGLEKINSVNPGSGNVDIWPIEQLRGIFSLLETADDFQPEAIRQNNKDNSLTTPLESIGVSLNSSSLMSPNKTISGMFYDSQKNFNSCIYCERLHCPDRKAPFGGVRL